MANLLSSSEANGLEERPSIRQIKEVMRIKDIEITTRWRDLGLELVDSNNVLKVIEADYPGDVNACCRVMFEKWLDQSPKASWSQLVTSLNNIGMNTAADAISKQFKQGPVTPSNSSANTTPIKLLDCDDIPTAFTHLTAEVTKLLKKVDFYALRRAIIQHKNLPNGVQFPDNLYQNIKAAQDLDRLLDLLAESKYWSWVDLRLLEALIVSSGIGEAKVLIDKYKDIIFSKKLSEVLDKMFMPQQKEAKDAYTSRVAVKIQKEPSEVTVGDLSQFASTLETVIMDINNGSCILEHLGTGCLEIHYRIPAHCRFHAYKSALSNRHKFCNIHLQYLCVESYPPVYNLFTIQPDLLSTLLCLPKPIVATPAEVIGHYYCFLLDNLDNNVARQIMVELKLLNKEDIVHYDKLYSDYQKTAFLLNQLLFAATSSSIVEFCHLLQNVKSHAEVGCKLINAIESVPASDVHTSVDLQSSGAPSDPTISKDNDTDIGPLYQPEVLLSAKTVHIRFLSVVSQLKQKLKHCNPEHFLSACNELTASASHPEVIPLLTSDSLEDLDNSDIEEILKRLGFLWTWNNHSVLRALLQACNCQDGIIMLDDFESQIDSSQPMEFFPVPPPSVKMAPYLSSAYTVLSIRGGHDQNGLPSLQYVNDVATIITEKFGISSHALQLLATQATPLMLYWMIPKSIVHLINSGVNEHLDFLRENGFSEFEIYPNTILFSTDILSHGSFALQHNHLQSAEVTEKVTLLEDTSDKKHVYHWSRAWHVGAMVKRITQVCLIVLVSIFISLITTHGQIHGHSNNIDCILQCIMSPLNQSIPDLLKQQEMCSTDKEKLQTSINSYIQELKVSKDNYAAQTKLLNNKVEEIENLKIALEEVKNLPSENCPFLCTNNYIEESVADIDQRLIFEAKATLNPTFTDHEDTHESDTQLS